MHLADQIERLHALRQTGALSDQEFQDAKSLLLKAAPLAPASDAPSKSDLLGTAANRFVSFHIKMAIIGGIVSSIFLLVFILVIKSDSNNRIRVGPSPEIQRIMDRSK